MNRTENNVTLVFYDIANSRLRGKIAKALKDFGVRIQYSVFICQLSHDAVARCCEKIHSVLHKFSKFQSAEDSVIIIQRINAAHISNLLGKRELLKEQIFEIY
jgi:CRISPR-associated protein Cas2